MLLFFFRFILKKILSRTEIDSSKIVKGKKIYKEIKRSEDWIYPRSFEFVEMYEGILLAADTLRSLGLNINIFIPMILKVIQLN